VRHLALILACVPLPRFSFETKTKPAPVRTLPLYSPQPGDEVIAAEVFKVPKETGISADAINGHWSTTAHAIPIPVSNRQRLRA
jgi:hypothetical protein